MCNVSLWDLLNHQWPIHSNNDTFYVKERTKIKINKYLANFIYVTIILLMQVQSIKKYKDLQIQKCLNKLHKIVFAYMILFFN